MQQPRRPRARALAPARSSGLAPSAPVPRQRQRPLTPGRIGRSARRVSRRTTSSTRRTSSGARAG
eukprot:3797373-Alexandrium_andersonii.AAC.1